MKIQRKAIVAFENSTGGIGLNNHLLFNIPEDIKHFHKTTKNTINPNNKNMVIMGRKTWESIPDKYKPLPGRLNVILSSKQYENKDNEIFFNSLEEYLENENKLVALHNIETIFVIGGETIYRIFMENNLIDVCICSHTSILSKEEVKYDSKFPILLLFTSFIERSEILLVNNDKYIVKLKEWYKN